MRIIIDVNIWVSFGIGKQLVALPDVVKNPAIEIFACNQLLHELSDVCSRPKLKKYLSEERVQEIFQLIDHFAKFEEPAERRAQFLDEKDNYLLDLCDTIDAKYLITGDISLLKLAQHNATEIISFNGLMEILSS
ncbi:MAG: putative toxin-antitoxin system toxin component, PIN family [Saprospiraceae bacterium]